MAFRLATIRPVQQDDDLQWRTLWADYCTFYNETVPDEATEALWHSLLNGDGAVQGLVAVGENDRLLGLTHYVLHPHTWSRQTLCYLEDLFVIPEARGVGTGSALIQRLIEMGKEEGWRRVYWHTHEDNAPARRVYDRFAPADDVVRYTVNL